MELYLVEGDMGMCMESDPVGGFADRLIIVPWFDLIKKSRRWNAGINRL